MSTKIRYNESLVSDVLDAYASYIKRHWETKNDSDVMGHRQYAQLKKRALEQVLSTYPTAKLAFGEWRRLQSRYGRAAHHKVVTQPQETGRRIMLGLAVLLRNNILKDERFNVMKANGELMGQYRRKPRKVEEDEVAEETQEKIEAPEASINDDLRWRLMDCVAKTGSIPGPAGLSALFGISKDEAQQGINWLMRTHTVSEKDGYFLVTPKGIDANKLVRLFQNQDRNAFELRALEALLEAMQD